MKQKDQIKPVEKMTIGFFVAFPEESQELKKLNLVNTGRSGIFYKKEDLVTTLESNTVLKDRCLDIIKIEVPPCAIISPNCVKFGIKGGKNIPIKKIQSLAEAIQEIDEVAVA